MEHEGRSLVLYFLFIFSVGYVHSENVATGTVYTFHPKMQGKIENFDWRHNGNLVVEWESGTQAHWYRYRERANINTDTGNLTLQVKKEDSGVFRGQFQVNGVLQYSEHTITVIDPVSEPKVTCKQNDTDITLLCSVDPPMQAEFTWTGPNGFSHVGKSVHITRKEKDESIYYCTAKNEVSNNAKEFNLNDCTTGGGNGADDGGNGGLIAGVLVPLLLLALVGVGAGYYFGIKKKASPDGTPGETAELKGENQSDPHLNSHNHADGANDALSKQDKENQGE